MSADISQDIPPTFSTQGRPRSGRPCLENAWGMSWEMSADTTDVLSADTTDVLAADTTDVLSADTSLQSSAMAPWSGGSFREDFDFWCQGMIFWRVLVGSRRSPASFLQGLATPMVRWEVSYEGKSFQKKFEFWSGPKFRKMSQMTWGGPPRTPKNIFKFGPGPKFGPYI